MLILPVGVKYSEQTLKHYFQMTWGIHFYSLYYSHVQHITLMPYVIRKCHVDTFKPALCFCILMRSGDD